MTFPEQILGVPPALVEHGWRRQPSQEVREKWLNAGSGHVWDRASIGNLTIHRPVKLASGTHTIVLALYSHAGWGDGLAPTPEMVKVWEYWWLRDPRGELMICRVQVYSEQDMETADYWIGDRIAFYSEIPEWGTWAGPVLPPVRQS